MIEVFIRWVGIGGVSPREKGQEAGEERVGSAIPKGGKPGEIEKSSATFCYISH